MIFDELSANLGHPAYSVQLTQPASPYVEASIEPWSEQDKFHSQGLSKKGGRARAPEGVVGFQPRRKSVDERIEEMKKKYSRESIRVENYIESGTPNSRQMYREKLNWLEKGQEFKQIGSERVIEEDMEEKEEIGLS